MGGAAKRSGEQVKGAWRYSLQIASGSDNVCA
jgi:hypothetical protein